jgi:hypothetical protein
MSCGKFVRRAGAIGEAAFLPAATLLMYRFRRFGSDIVGAWRSLVAHLPWAQGVAGSNPVAPTIAPVAQMD